MLRTVVLGALAASCVALALGCGKKSDPEPAPNAGGPPPPPRPDDPAQKPGGPPPNSGGTAAGPADKGTAASHLKQIGLALHNFESANQYFPAGVVGPRGTLGLSWRVAVLPYLEGEEHAKLYAQFRLNEPWDSPHNKVLVPRMPKEFAPPGRPAAEGKTHLRAFAGMRGFVPEPQPIGPKGFRPRPPWANLQPGLLAPGQRVNGITDGTSNTFAVVEAADAVEWTRPDELPLLDALPGTPPAPLPKLGGHFPGGFHALMLDGAVYFFPSNLSEASRRALATTSQGDAPGPDALAVLRPR